MKKRHAFTLEPIGFLRGGTVELLQMRTAGNRSPSVRVGEDQRDKRQARPDSGRDGRQHGFLGEDLRPISLWDLSMAALSGYSFGKIGTRKTFKKSALSRADEMNPFV